MTRKEGRLIGTPYPYIYPFTSMNLLVDVTSM